MSLIECHQGLRQATFTVNGHEQPIRICDRGVGDLWLYRDSVGVAGVVRSRTFEEAWQCVVDEILPDAAPDQPDNQLDLHADELPEGIYRRSKGAPTNEGLRSPLAREDLNGSLLQPLTAGELERLGITLYVEDI